MPLIWLKVCSKSLHQFEEHLIIHMVSAADQAKRALASVLRSLLSLYSVALVITRDSADAEIRTAYRTLSRKTHPDRGGRLVMGVRRGGVGGPGKERSGGGDSGVRDRRKRVAENRKS